MSIDRFKLPVEKQNNSVSTYYANTFWSKFSSFLIIQYEKRDFDLGNIGWNADYSSIDYSINYPSYFCNREWKIFSLDGTQSQWVDSLKSLPILE